MKKTTKKREVGEGYEFKVPPGELLIHLSSPYGAHTCTLVRPHTPRVVFSAPSVVHTCSMAFTGRQRGRGSVRAMHGVDPGHCLVLGSLDLWLDSFLILFFFAADFPILCSVNKIM